MPFLGIMRHYADAEFFNQKIRDTLGGLFRGKHLHFYKKTDLISRWHEVARIRICGQHVRFIMENVMPST